MMASPDNRHNRDHERKLENYYRLHSRIYDTTRWSFLFGRHTLLDRLPNLPSQPRILEVGCGTGRNMQYLEYQFPDAHLVGIDLSHDMLLKAETKIEQTDQVTLIEGSYANETPKLEPFDLILFSYTLTMTGDQAGALLQQAYEDLKPGGYIAAVDFHTTPFHWFRHWMKANHVDLNGHHLMLLNKYYQPSIVDVNKAYFGLWSYFLFLGQRL